MTHFSENVISLRTAVFDDDGVLGTLVLLPPDPDRRPDGHLHGSVCWVYRRHPSLVEGNAKACLKKHQNACVFENLKPLRIRLDPDVRFLWSESGQSVAAVVDGEPMGFISEHKHCPYSKSEKTPPVNQNPWDEDVFRRLFPA
ncbi:MAG: hypothetical protein DME22_14860 [Verrucomicrobia bacterium]|nr:MAG: hypothetical protein DME22_14860 [Verrucomicrobiota bacterium]PYJ95507.1 MAG: hypothetical protein DME23_23885 [Verrucomicrobiota bacterium]